jgi:hypothetical protein
MLKNKFNNFLLRVQALYLPEQPELQHFTDIWLLKKENKTWIYEPPSLLSNGYQGLFPWG